MEYLWFDMPRHPETFATLTMPHTFRSKLGFLLLILVIPFLISQAIYRQTISALHGTLFSSVDVLTAIHATETFHTSLHGMLAVAKQFAVDRAKRPSPEDWSAMGKHTREALGVLLASHHSDSEHGRHFPVDVVQRADEITALYVRVTEQFDAMLSRPATELPIHLATAQKLFDEINRNHLATLHSGHQQRLEQMKSDAHGLKQRIDYLFYGQTLFGCVVVIVALLFSEKILVKGYLRTKDESLSDGLTKARNRRHLETVTEREVSDLMEQGTPFSVALVDIDHFKRVNDQLGHQAGDEVLRLVADIIRKRLRKSDTFVRYGGEEFLVLLPGAEKSAAVDVVEKIRESIGARTFSFAHVDTPWQVTTSAGVASFPNDGLNDFHQLLRAADERLYRAKNGGRNQCVSQDSLASPVLLIRQ